MNITVQAILALSAQTNLLAWNRLPNHWNFMLFYTVSLHSTRPPPHTCRLADTCPSSGTRSSSFGSTLSTLRPRARLLRRLPVSSTAMTPWRISRCRRSRRSCTTPSTRRMSLETRCAPRRRRPRHHLSPPGREVILFRSVLKSVKHDSFVIWRCRGEEEDHAFRRIQQCQTIIPKSVSESLCWSQSSSAMKSAPPSLDTTRAATCPRGCANDVRLSDLNKLHTCTGVAFR